MQINRSYFNQSLINFNFAIAHTIHNFNKTCIAVEKKKILAKKTKQESMMDIESNNDDVERQTVNSFNKSGNASIMVNEVRSPQEIQSRAQQIKQKLMKYKLGKQAQANVQSPAIQHDYQSKDIDQTVFNHFSNQLRPKILSKYPTAPADKINKVILQKWNSLQKDKKEGFTRSTLKRIQAAKQTKKQEQEPTQQQQGEQEEVLVKQQAPQPQPQPQTNDQKIEAKQNRFGDFLNRIKKNIKGMQQQNEKNKVFKEENENEHDDASRMEEQHSVNRDEQNINEDIKEKQEEQGQGQEQGEQRQLRRSQQQQQRESQTDEMQQQK